MEEKVMKDCKVLALCSQKGGVGKTTSCVNLAVGLAKAGKKVLVIDNDPQGSMTASLGYHNPDELPITLATILTKIVEDELFENTLGILHHQEGIDLIPANIELSGMEVSLVNIMSRELVLKQYIERMREEYDYILIDCMPSLGMLAPFDIAELREIMSYDEMELDKIGDRKTALFLIMSDTDTTFNFVIAMLQSQLFNLLCDKADDEYGGRLPVHVRVIADEFANSVTRSTPKMVGITDKSVA